MAYIEVISPSGWLKSTTTTEQPLSDLPIGTWTVTRVGGRTASGELVILYRSERALGCTPFGILEPTFVQATGFNTASAALSSYRFHCAFVKPQQPSPLPVIRGSFAQPFKITAKRKVRSAFMEDACSVAYRPQAQRRRSAARRLRGGAQMPSEKFSRCGIRHLCQCRSPGALCNA